jgi:hypothetical protein
MVLHLNALSPQGRQIRVNEAQPPGEGGQRRGGYGGGGGFGGGRGGGGYGGGGYGQARGGECITAAAPCRYAYGSAAGSQVFFALRMLLRCL